MLYNILIILPRSYKTAINRNVNIALRRCRNCLARICLFSIQYYVRTIIDEYDKSSNASCQLLVRFRLDTVLN